MYQTWTNPLWSFPGPEISRWTDVFAKFHFLTGRRVKHVHSLHKKYGRCGLTFTDAKNLLLSSHAPLFESAQMR